MTWLGKKIIDYNTALPWYYGLAYYHDFGHISVCYPVPINWIVFALREAWWKLRCPPRGATNRFYDEGHSDGYKRGYKVGTIDGKLDGWLLGYDAAKAPPQLEKPHSFIRDDSQHPLNRLARGERVL